MRRRRSFEKRPWPLPVWSSRDLVGQRLFDLARRRAKSPRGSLYVLGNALGARARLHAVRDRPGLRLQGPDARQAGHAPAERGRARLGVRHDAVSYTHLRAHETVLAL